MKILQINNVYQYGSTGKITRDIHHGLLARGIESVVYYGRRSRTDEPGVAKFCWEWYAKFQNGFSRFSGMIYSGAFLSTGKLIQAIRREKPDVVHLQCLNGYFVNIYRLLEFLKKEQIPTVLTLHAEFMYTGGCSHALECTQWKQPNGCTGKRCTQWMQESHSVCFDRKQTMWQKMNRAFSGMEHLAVVSVSPWLKERAAASAILKGKQHTVVYNGVDTNIFHAHSGAERKQMKESLGIDAQQKVIFFAAPSIQTDPNHIKGGAYFLRLAQSMPDCQFVAAGAYSPDLAVPPNVMLLGTVADRKKLAQLYAMADITVLTSKRETFSMVCAESLCCGTPVVGFEAGAPETIAIPEYSAFCAFGDTGALRDNCRKMLACEFDKEKRSKEAQMIYNNERMIEEYTKIYQELVAQRKL